jgi:apolipoprotein N-acyltransferase
MPEVLICYEAIFSNRLYEEIQQTNWLLNITNDAWFGRSIGPYQHFNMARLRAVERGKPLVRVANTGISGVINSYGKIVSKSSLNTEFYSKEILPSKTYPTFYTKYNYYPLFFILLLSFIFVYYINKYNYKYTQQKESENG